MDRKGISFTLTMVVAGVILIMTALSVITLGGSSISNFFNTITGQQEQAVTQAEVQQACQDRAQQVRNQYCSLYIDPSAGNPCATAQETRDTDHTRTASQEGCSWDPYTPSLSPTVTVQGNTYNCVEEGYLRSTCPVQ